MSILSFDRSGSPVIIPILARYIVLSAIVLLGACSNDTKDDQNITINKVEPNGFNVSIDRADRQVFSELLQPLDDYIQLLEVNNTSAINKSLTEFKKIIIDDAKQGFKAQYNVNFFDQYSLVGNAEKISQHFCDKVVSTTHLSLNSDDQALNIQSMFEETQSLDHSQANYLSTYFYQVSEDKVNVNQKVEGSLKRQFNGLAHIQELPYRVEALHDAESFFLYQSLAYKLEQLEGIKRTDETVSFSYLSAPEDVDSSVVLNVVEGRYKGLQLNEATLNTYLLEIKHFLRDEQGEWVDDGHSVEWLSDSGVMLYESFLMPTGLSMQYALHTVQLLEKPVCQ